MFEIDVRKAKPTIKNTEPLLTSGSLNAFSVHFIFNDDWDGMTKFAVFKTAERPAIEIVLDDTNTCDIPWELLQTPGQRIQCGAYGISITDQKQIRLPTIWLKLDEISEGVLYGVEGREPTPDIYEQFVDALNKIPEPMTAAALREILTGGETV